MKKIILAGILLFLTSAFKGDPIAYKIYDKAGKEVEWKELVKYAKNQQVVFFGELHSSPISHWLQLKLTQDLYAENKNLSLGAEMFEADQQMILNEYVSKIISDKNFETEMRLWPNYKTDYKPLVEFAIANNLPVIATNVPRRYASVVSKKGREELSKVSPEAKAFIAPLPLEVDTTLPGYKEMLTMDMGGKHAQNINMVYAQALKDATMGYFINKNLKEKGLFLHYNGAYHSDNFEGAVYYLKKYNSAVRMVTITTVQQEDPSRIEKENIGKADFIIVTDKQMTGTH